MSTPREEDAASWDSFWDARAAAHEMRLGLVWRVVEGPDGRFRVDLSPGGKVRMWFKFDNDPADKGVS